MKKKNPGTLDIDSPVTVIRLARLPDLQAPSRPSLFDLSKAEGKCVSQSRTQDNLEPDVQSNPVH
jgi:hypothetical protein